MSLGQVDDRLRTGERRQRPLSFGERIRAQEAIERVFYSHQIGTRRPFESAVSRELLDAKVTKYLRQTRALEEIWHTPVTAEMLRRELDRIVRGSKLPGRLQELFAALDDDAFLIQECLARPLLVDRLTRSFFTYDDRIHAASRAEAEALHTQIASRQLSIDVEHQRRTVLDLPRETASTGPGTAFNARASREDVAIGGGPVRHVTTPAPRTVGEVGSLEELPDAFAFDVVLARSDKLERLAAYSVPKASWDEWWRSTCSRLDPWGVEPVADAGAVVPALGTGQPNARGSGADDVWDNGMLDDLPEPVASHAAVWTGSVMFVWGGIAVTGPSRAGWLYDPATDTWTRASSEGAPSGRDAHTMVWTGTEVVIWGGDAGESIVGDGGRYDPAADRWSTMSNVGAPSARINHTSVWANGQMIVWGGSSAVDGGLLNTGGRYDPVLDSWTPTATAGAPSLRIFHTALWTGSRMVVWGGKSSYGASDPRLNTGGRYDPASDTWQPTSTTGAPAPRSSHAAVWTGARMIVWGGINAMGLGQTNSGARYDPVADTWRPTSLVNAPGPRARTVAVWTGQRMVVWGGYSLETLYDSGGRYDPVSNSWTATTLVDAPAPREYHTGVWTGSLLLVWGGFDSGNPPWQLHGPFVNGGRYDPQADLWTPLPVNVPDARTDHTAIWTGSEMIVWGGRVRETRKTDTGRTNTGSRYNPTTDSWSATSRSSAPEPRGWHTAVWTGHEMIVWGGYDNWDSLHCVHHSSGGRYDPISDSWLPVTLNGAPPGRDQHTAVWTGSEMIVWGGTSSATPDCSSEPFALNSGSRYDPDSDSWVPMSTVGAPEGRRLFTSVWTGSEMIVWGGLDAPWGGPFGTGGRYDVSVDRWRPTSALDAPSPRSGHTAVWTGSEMIVWGGSSGEIHGGTNTGARYNPSADTWHSTSTGGLSPAGRTEHTAVWTGSEMLVWGGLTATSYTNSGGRYRPATDSWSAMSLIDAPTARTQHTAVWTGESMIVWGGSISFLCPILSGGRYVAATDGDGDGVPDPRDCAPSDPGAFAVPPELSDLVIAPDLQTVGWRSAAPDAGSATVYDLLRGSCDELPVGNRPLETCVAAGTVENQAPDTARPGPASAFWYLGRGRNACGAGTYGDQSNGAERVSSVCP